MVVGVGFPAYSGTNPAEGGVSEGTPLEEPTTFGL